MKEEKQNDEVNQEKQEKHEKQKPQKQKNIKVKKTNIYDLAPFLNKKISVIFAGGRKIKGILKSYDTLENMILDDVEEIFPNDNIRELGLAFIKGSSLESVIPGEYEEIPELFKEMITNDFK